MKFHLKNPQRITSEKLWVVSEKEFKTGWYNVVITSPDCSSTVIKISFDFGSGFLSSQGTKIRKSNNENEKGVYSGLVQLDRKPREIKVWTDHDHQLNVHRISNFTVIAQGFEKAVKLLARNPKENLGHVYFATKSFFFDNRFRQMRSQIVSAEQRYEEWISANEHTNSILKNGPLLSIVVPLYRSDPNLLESLIASVCNLSYEDWELCFCIDREISEESLRLLREKAKENSKINFTFLKNGSGISDATNQAAYEAKGEWLIFVDHDDLLPKNALSEIAHIIKNNPNAQMIYSDEDKIDMKGIRHSPYFKSGFSYELLCSMNYLNHLTVHRTKNFRDVGGLNSRMDGAQDYDLILRILEKINPKDIIHIPKILYHWREAETSTAKSLDVKPEAASKSALALNAHFQRIGRNSKAITCKDTGYLKVTNAITGNPRVSIIIPTKDKLGLLKKCIDSLLSKTNYQNYEVIIIDNRSEEKSTINYFKSVSANDKITVVEYDDVFNFSKICNTAAELAKSDYLCFVNNDIEFLSEGWLEEMLGWAQLGHVGAVGAKLLFPNNTIQHAGIILGIGGIAGHAHKYYNSNSPGYYGKLKVAQNYSAVTGACLLVHKDKYERVGGMDERLKVAYNDVDLCLKLMENGLRNVWTPNAIMYHHESATRGKKVKPSAIQQYETEIKIISEKWQNLLQNDPFYSPHLTKEREDFSID